MPNPLNPAQSSTEIQHDTTDLARSEAQSHPTRQRWTSHPAARAAIVTLMLFVIGGIVQPRSLQVTSLLSMLPFMAILAVTVVGQHLVIQQRGLDISVAGIMSFSSTLVTAWTPPDSGVAAVVRYVVLALLMGFAAGALNGLLVAFMRVPSLVATIGTNAILLGCVLFVSHGTPSNAPSLLASFALNRTFGIPNTVFVMAAVVAAVAALLHGTLTGRRFHAISVSPAAARAVAIPVNLYIVATYVFAGGCYAAAGVMLAGFLNSPGLYAGNGYVLASVAAVVVGGNAMTGGRGSLLASVLGAAFLTYLSQLILSLGFERHTQDIVQAAIVLLGVGMPAFAGLLSRSQPV
ncbi:ribose transport system permease protein [Burkholderia sp. OK233]|nr:ribose transport system permease protein [Burkholderia sp. OK233]